MELDKQVYRASDLADAALGRGVGAASELHTRTRVRMDESTPTGTSGANMFALIRRAAYARPALE